MWRSAQFVAIVLGLSLASPALAGTVCSGIKVKEDKFGGGKSAVAVVQALSQLRAVGVMLSSKSGTVTLTMTVKEAGALNGGVAAGSQIAFSFADGEVITLSTAQDASFQSYVSGESIMTNVPYSFVLDPAQLEKFANTAVVAARVPVMSQGTTYDWEANSGVQKKLQSAAQCMKTL
jgi:hypothetical protein